MGRTRVAVIGAGIAGLGAAWRLERSGRVDVTILEEAPRLGGHTCTELVPGAARDGSDLPVDMGFIVHNERTYPRLIALLDQLDVRTRSTEMSFSVSCRGCGLEYAGRAVTRQLDRFLQPRMLRLVREIRQFWQDGTAALDDPAIAHLTLQQFVDQRGYSLDFQHHYLVPLTAAIWSTAPAGVLDFPIAAALRFLHNHGVLQLRGHEWRTVVGGSHAYVDALRARLDADVHCATPVLAVRRDGDGVRVRTAGSDAEQRFDHVVLATHADTSLALLADADQLERELLGAFEFTDNETVLHEDRTMLPRRSSSIAAWNYQLSACFPDDRRPTMTYSMNRLQGLDTERTLAVTLNRGEEIDERLVHARRWFSHPRFTHAALDAQARLPHLDGRRDTWFCGAWQRHGFHEDGLWSGTRAADSLLERLRDAAPAGHAPGVD